MCRPHSHSPMWAVCFPSQLAGLIWFFTSLGDSSIKCFDAWHVLIAGQNIRRSQLLQFYQWKGLWEIKIRSSVSNLKNITVVVLIGETDWKKDIFPLLYCSTPLSPSFFLLQKMFEMSCHEWRRYWTDGCVNSAYVGTFGHTLASFYVI